MKIRINIGHQKETVLSATLDDNETARDFASLLPLTLKMDDLFGREKYGRLPKALSTKGKREFTYKVGQLVYWSPSRDVAIFYRDDREKIPSPGIIVMGKVDGGIKVLNVPGSVTVTIDRQ